MVVVTRLVGMDMSVWGPSAGMWGQGDPRLLVRQPSPSVSLKSVRDLVSRKKAEHNRRYDVYLCPPTHPGMTYMCAHIKTMCGKVQGRGEKGASVSVLVPLRSAW